MVSSYEELQENLEQHYCSEKFYRVNPYISTVITEGVKYLCDKGSCYWLIDHILFNGGYELSKSYGFLIIYITVNKRGTCNIVIKEDSGEDMPVLLNKKVKDICKLIPSGEYKLYFIDNVILLPSEY